MTASMPFTGDTALQVLEHVESTHVWFDGRDFLIDNREVLEGAELTEALYRDGAGAGLVLVTARLLNDGAGYEAGTITICS